MIAKCQKSIETTEPSGTQLLIYNRTREWIWSGDITQEWNDVFSPGEFKFYAEVRWNDGRVPPTLVKRLHDQGWDNRIGEYREFQGANGGTTISFSIGSTANRRDEHG